VQTEAAATTKALSSIDERRVAGMTSEDDAAERKCFLPGTSVTRRTSDDRHLGALEHQCRHGARGHHGADVRAV